LDFLTRALKIAYTDSVREEKGGTYGVSVAFELDKDDRPNTTLRISYNADPSRYGELNPIIYEQLLHIAQQGPAEASMQKIKEYLVKQYQQAVITNDYWIDDAIDFGYDGGIFTHHQYEAIMNDMTPLEFGDRQLSYGELAVLDDEFDGAFIVDEDCLDDWSDNGLGANARITYIEDRRTGRISGPEEFDCPERFRK
jgi:hypothetical protein